MFNKKLDTNKLSILTYSINVELELLNSKIDDINNSKNNKKIINEIDTISQNLQKNLQNLKLMMEYDEEEIELLDIDDEEDIELLDINNDLEESKKLELYKTEVLNDLTTEIEILDNDLYKTKLLEGLEKELNSFNDKKENELKQLKKLENTLSISLEEINNKMNSSKSNEIKQINKTLNVEINDTNIQLRKKIKALKTKRLIWSILLALFVLILAIILIIIEFRLFQKEETKKQIKDLDKYINTTEIKQETIEISEDHYDEYYKQAYENIIENNTFDQNDDYHKFISTNILSIDFDGIKKINSDTVGWIRLENTNVNYPIVHGSDNFYYLKHSFDKSLNYMGWIYMDYRNEDNFNNKNTIIYGHGLIDNTMFGSLRNAFDEKWYTDIDNQIIKIYTENGFLLYQIFSLYTIEPEDYYITTDFESDEEYQEFLVNIKNRSIYDFHININELDKILTLSTCYDDSKRAVFHAKLIYKSF